MNANAIDNGEGCSTKVSSAHVQDDSTSGYEIEAVSSQTVATSFSNFEDVFGKGNIYDHDNEAPAADSNTEEATADIDGIEDRVTSSKSASGQTTANSPRNSRKRKSAESGPDHENVSQNTRRKGKQPINDAPRQPLEESHLISDALRINEFAVDLQLHGQRHSSLAESTKKAYEICQRTWVEWCDRKRYPNYLVTKTKFQVFMSENLAEDTDEENDIRPLRVYRERMEKARNSPGFNKNDYLPKADTVDQYVKALVDLYETQKAKDPVAMAGQDHPRTAGIKALLRNYRLRLGEIAKSAHAETLTVGDGYEVDFLKEIMRVGWTHTYQASTTTSNNRRSGHVGLRNRLSLCWCHFMMCRGENMRMATLCDISSYMFRHNSQDGHYSLGVTLSMLQGKTNREGKENYGVVVRNKDVEICPVGALAFYLLEMWMDPGDLPFDDPNWFKLYLMPGRFAFKEFSSGAHYATVKALFNAAGVVSKKKTHVARGTGSRHAQDAGADIASIENHGGWGKGRVSTHYLSRISDDVPSKMAGCTLPGERLWLARGTILPPVALQRMLFPFVEDFAERTESPADWLQWTENLMLDKNMYDNRPIETRIKITGKDVRYVRMLFLLTHLRKVLLQDAVALMELLDAPFRYEDHGVFRHPAFSLENPLFRKFREDLGNNMRIVKSPMEDSLLANAPAIHNEFRTVHSSVQRVDHTLQANTDAIQQLTKLADNVVQQITSKVAADGQSLDRVYEFMERMGEIMEKMGGNMVRAARRERRSPQVQQQQQQQQQQGHPRKQGQPEQQGQPEEQQPPEQGPFHLGQGHTEPQGPIEPAVAMISRGLTWEEKLVALETQLASRYAQIPPRNIEDVDPTMLPRSAPLQRHWDERFQGVEGRPSLWILNKTFKARWRKGGGNTVTKTFSFKKAIVFSVLKMILNDNEGGTLDEKETRTLDFLTRHLNSGATLNQHYLLVTRGSRSEARVEE